MAANHPGKKLSSNPLWGACTVPSEARSSIAPAPSHSSGASQILPWSPTGALVSQPIRTPEVLGPPPASGEGDATYPDPPRTSTEDTAQDSACPPTPSPCWSFHHPHSRCMSFCPRGCGKQGQHPSAAIPPAAFGEERTFRQAKSFNPGLPYPPPDHHP